MDWKDKHNQRVEQMPNDVREARRHSINHRTEILASERCGCFYCCAMFSPDVIREWTDNDDAGLGQTALCPPCGIGSVLGDKSGFEISKAFLESMKSLWF